MVPNTQPQPLDQVQFAPTYGRLSAAGDHWQIAVQGRVVTPRPDNLRKKFLLRLFRRALRADAAQLQSALLQSRLEDFLMLGLSHRPLTVNVANRPYPLKKRSEQGGYFNSSIRVPRPEVESLKSATGCLHAIEFEHGEHHATRIPGWAMLVQPVGPSVITDIDDTLKLTEASNRRQLLMNTFVNPFEPIMGMAEVFRTWELCGAAIHYVSASPWQLFRPLHEFLLAEGFPRGSFHLRPIHLQGAGTVKLLMGGKREKRKSVRDLLRWFPRRRFVLLGDSGERDPEIYGWAARRYPEQVEMICIRRISEIKRKRFRRAFREVPKAKIRIFEVAEELQDIKAVAHAGWEV